MGRAKMGKTVSKQFFVAAAVIAGLHIAPLSAQQSVESSDRIRVAQACGWYAITHCSRSYSDARRFSRRNGSGRVIDTSSRRYPNFQPGYYCVADGPMGRGSAASAARTLRRQGFSDAYAKSAC